MFKFKNSQISMVLICFFLIACGGGGSDGGGESGTTGTESKNLNDKATTTSNEVTSVFSGSVVDGPVVGATLEIYDKRGNLLKTEITDKNARYSTRITTQKEAYPLIIEVTGGTDLVTNRAIDFKLTSVVVDSSVKYSNVNPFSTLIVESARSMTGGLNNDNLNIAKRFIINNMNFGLDSQLISDPITSEINDLNIGVIVKSSEAFAEMIRRTHDTLINTGTVSNMNDVVKALAADMTDGLLDGIGGAAAHKRIAAVSTLVSAKVLVEALSNNLSVDGNNATSKMDDAIKTVNPQAPSSSMTGKVRINEKQLQQTKVSISASITLLPSTELSAIADVLKTLKKDSLPADIEAVLPANAGSNIDEVIAAVSAATKTEIDQFNRLLVELQDNRVRVNVNRLPLLSGTPTSNAVLTGSLYDFQPSARDPDGDTLVFSIVNPPAWINFNVDTGRLWGTPSEADVGTTADIIISVSDGNQKQSLPPFFIAVNLNTPSNTVPSIEGIPSNRVDENNFYSFQPIASDLDNDTLAYSISNKPIWARFNTASGKLSGTPSNRDIGTTSNIVISVNDGSVPVSLAAFSIRVVNVNSPPVITGVPARAVYENTSYRFTPTVKDSDADLLTYSISNKPSWASFDRATGILTGVPNHADIGTTSNINISVTDAFSFAVPLGEFSITVESTTVVLSWVAPTQNADSKPLSLSEIKGYKIYTGTDANNLTFLFDTKDSSINEHTIRNLAAAKHYYAITTYNQSEMESVFSVIASKTINSL